MIIYSSIIVPLTHKTRSVQNKCLFLALFYATQHDETKKRRHQVSHMSSAFPIRTKETLKRMAPIYFKLPGPSQPGDSRVPVGKLLITPTNSSLFVVRVVQRSNVPRRAFNYRRNRGGYLSHANYYRGFSQDYRVAEIRWSDGHVTELSQHATRDEANAMLIALHGER